MRFSAVGWMVVLTLAAGCAAQTFPDRPPAPSLPGMPTTPSLPGLPLVGPVTASPEVIELLRLLHDRKSTLRDFVAKIDYNVEDPRGDATGKRGSVGYLVDPAKGPIFSADFTMSTAEGKPKLAVHSQIIFDGQELTVKDWGLDGKSKKFARSNLLPIGAKPGDAVTLNGALTLPIGLDVNDVLKTFIVTQLPSKDSNLGILKLIPRPGTKFDYKRLDVTVDRKQELPITLAQTAPDDTVTTITLTDIQINPGTATMLNPATPAADGWTPMGGTPGATPAPATGGGPAGPALTPGG